MSQRLGQKPGKSGNVFKRRLRHDTMPQIEDKRPLCERRPDCVHGHEMDPPQRTDAGNGRPDGR